MVFLCVPLFYARYRIYVLATKLFPTLPAPRFSTSCSNHEGVISCRKTTRKYIITGRIFQTPTLTPRTLFRILCIHFVFYKILKMNTSLELASIFLFTLYFKGMNKKLKLLRSGFVIGSMSLQEKVDASKITGTLDISNMGLSSLPELPTTLTTLDCSRNALTYLPPLPLSLTRLYCSENKLTSLPTLPQTLIGLFCSQNQLTSLPALPSTLTKLWCLGNTLTSLPELPNLCQLHCSHNQLTTLPPLPFGMLLFAIYENPYNPSLYDFLSSESIDLLQYGIARGYRSKILAINEYVRNQNNRKNARNCLVLKYTLVDILSYDSISVIGSYLSGQKGDLSKQIAVIKYQLRSEADILKPLYV